MTNMHIFPQDVTILPTPRRRADPMSGADAPLPPRCNLCGGAEFGPGPGGRTGPGGSTPHCMGCGALERQRAVGAALRMLPPDYLAWRRALQVGAPPVFDPRRLPAWTLSPQPAPGRLAPQLHAAMNGSYDLIALVHVLEFLDDDRGDFHQLMGLLSPQGVLLACLADPQGRPWTSIQAGPAGSVRRRYGRDVLRHFRREQQPLHMSMLEASDPVTGLVLPVHFFYRHPEHHQPLAALAAT
jgi:hypothetical protein